MQQRKNQGPHTALTKTSPASTFWQHQATSKRAFTWIFTETYSFDVQHGYHGTIKCLTHTTWITTYFYSNFVWIHQLIIGVFRSPNWKVCTAWLKFYILSWYPSRDSQAGRTVTAELKPLVDHRGICFSACEDEILSVSWNGFLMRSHYILLLAPSIN